MIDLPGDSEHARARHRRTPPSSHEPQAIPESQYLGDLLARIVIGDLAAFSEFYEATSARVYGLVLRILRSPGYSEDTTQEVYLQIWRTADRYDPSRGSPEMWLLTIAHRRAIDRVRSEQAGNDRDTAYNHKTATRDYDEVLETVTQSLESEQVVHCLGTLTDNQRETIWLAYYRGLTYAEVAARVGAGLPAVKSRIRDGLIRLKMCMGNEQ